MDLINFFTPQVIAANWTENQSNRIPYLGRGLFPTDKKAGLDLGWLKGHKGLAISLMPSAFDAKATFRDRIGVEKIETEMPFFREGIKIKEKDRQDLLRIEEVTDPYAQTIIARVFDDANELLDGADVVPERMIMQLLFAVDGSVGIEIRANGVDYTYNYDPDGTWKANNYVSLSGNDTWDKPSTADPIKSISAVKSKAKSDNGTVLTGMIMSNNTYNMMSATDAIKNRYLTTIGRPFGYLTDTEVNSVLADTLNMNIAVYDKWYRDENKETHAFVPDGYVAIIPSGPLGKTWYGTTPEEADLRGSGKADVSIVNTGVAISRVIQEHPVNTNIFASEIVLPSYERMGEVYLMKVTA